MSCGRLGSSERKGNDMGLAWPVRRALLPGEIVASVLRLSDVTERCDAELGTALRWGYGSAFGLWHGVLRRRLSEPWASLIFGATLMSVATVDAGFDGPRAGEEPSTRPTRLALLFARSDRRPAGEIDVERHDAPHFH